MTGAGGRGTPGRDPEAPGSRGEPTGVVGRLEGVDDDTSDPIPALRRHLGAVAGRVSDSGSGPDLEGVWARVRRRRRRRRLSGAVAVLVVVGAGAVAVGSVTGGDGGGGEVVTSPVGSVPAGPAGSTPAPPPPTGPVVADATGTVTAAPSAAERVIVLAWGEGFLSLEGRSVPRAGAAPVLELSYRTSVDGRVWSEPRPVELSDGSRTPRHLVAAAADGERLVVVTGDDDPAAPSGDDAALTVWVATDDPGALAARPLPGLDPSARSVPGLAVFADLPPVVSPERRVVDVILDGDSWYVSEQTTVWLEVAALAPDRLHGADVEVVELVDADARGVRLLVGSRTEGGYVESVEAVDWAELGLDTSAVDALTVLAADHRGGGRLGGWTAVWSGGVTDTGPSSVRPVVLHDTRGSGGPVRLVSGDGFAVALTPTPDDPSSWWVTSVEAFEGGSGGEPPISSVLAQAPAPVSAGMVDGGAVAVFWGGERPVAWRADDPVAWSRVPGPEPGRFTVTGPGGSGRGLVVPVAAPAGDGIGSAGPEPALDHALVVTFDGEAWSLVDVPDTDDDGGRLVAVDSVAANGGVVVAHLVHDDGDAAWFRAEPPPGSSSGSGRG